MKFKKVPIDDNAKSGKEMIIELESGEHVYMLINKLNSEFQKLAERYGVSKKTIQNAIKGVTWKCVPYMPEPPKED